MALVQQSTCMSILHTIVHTPYSISGRVLPTHPHSHICNACARLMPPLQAMCPSRHHVRMQAQHILRSGVCMSWAQACNSASQCLPTSLLEPCLATKLPNSCCSLPHCNFHMCLTQLSSSNKLRADRAAQHQQQPREVPRLSVVLQPTRQAGPTRPLSFSKPAALGAPHHAPTAHLVGSANLAKSHFMSSEKGWEMCTPEPVTLATWNLLMDCLSR